MAEPSPKVVKIWTKRHTDDVFNDMSDPEITFYLGTINDALLAGDATCMKWFDDDRPKKKKARKFYVKKFKQTPETTFFSSGKVDLELLHLELSEGKEEWLKCIPSSPDSAALRKAYHVRYDATPEQTYSRGKRRAAGEPELTNEELERKLRHAAGETQSTNGVGDLDAIINDEDKRKRFFATLRELRIHHPDVVVPYLNGNLKLRGHFRDYLKSIAAGSNPEGRSTSNRFEDGAVLSPLNHLRLTADQAALKQRLGWDVAGVAVRANVDPQALVTGIKDTSFKLGRTQLVKVMNAMLDLLTADEIAHIVRPRGATYTQLTQALTEHVSKRRPQSKAKLRKIPS